MNKKTVLFCGEAHYIPTGYGVYTNEILSRLAAKNKYNIVELGNYGTTGDPQATNLWTFEGVLPRNEQEQKIFESSPLNHFGRHKFEEICLKYKPDVVCSYLDNWMMTHHITSPYRPRYSLIWMPTVDSEPQPDEWIGEYQNCDAVLTYSTWAYNLLKEQSSKIKLRGIASPAADYNLFKPLNKAQVKKKWGVNGFVIGTTMRNQQRKLIPQLIKAFEQIKYDCWLYIHTTWPDMGWNLPNLIKQSPKANRILVTYTCQQCGHVFCSNFQDAITNCKRCGNYSAIMPSPQKGAPREILPEIYNLFDVYVQYHNSEGFGMPVVEAAACGVPVFSTDYSAQASVVRELGGYPIEVKAKYLDPNKQTYFGLPDDADFIYKISKYLSLPEHLKERKQFEAAKKAREHFDYDKSAATWEKLIDEMPAGTWDAPKNIRANNPEPPRNLTPVQLLEWAIVNILGRIDLLGTYFHTKRIRDLNMGVVHDHLGGPSANEMSAIGIKRNKQPYSAHDMLNEMANIRTNINRWESKR